MLLGGLRITGGKGKTLGNPPGLGGGRLGSHGGLGGFQRSAVVAEVLWEEQWDYLGNIFGSSGSVLDHVIRLFR
jgi:hypothetical protein